MEENNFSIEYKLKEIEYKSLKDNQFKQQNLRSWRPETTEKSTTITFFVSGIVFFIIGIVRLHFSNKVNVININYTNSKCNDSIKTCWINFTLNVTLKQPVFVIYKLENFYQNNRRYVNSKSIQQLQNKFVSNQTLEENCFPIIKVEQLGIFLL